MYIIKDWSDKQCFAGKSFNTPDEAEAFLRAALQGNNEDKYEIDRGEFRVIELIGAK